MIAWTPEQVAAAISVLVAAVAAAAVTLAKTYASVVNIVESLNRAGVPVRGARGERRPAPARDSVAQAGSGSGASLLPVDPINQLAGNTVTAAPAVTGPYDCGPACVVSCIEELRGCWSADELLRLRYFGVVDSRLTTADDLVGMLRANGIDAHAREVDAKTMQVEVVRNWNAGRPSLVLGNYVSPNVAHWVKFIGDANGPVVMNPWPGGRSRWSWPDFMAAFDRWYVHVDSASLP